MVVGPFPAPVATGGLDPVALRTLCQSACQDFLVGGRRDRAGLVATLVREKGRVSKQARLGNDSSDALYRLSLCLKRVEKTLGFHECKLWNECAGACKYSQGQMSWAQEMESWTAFPVEARQATLPGPPSPHPPTRPPLAIVVCGRPAPAQPTTCSSSPRVPGANQPGYAVCRALLLEEAEGRRGVVQSHRPLSSASALPVVLSALASPPTSTVGGAWPRARAAPTACTPVQLAEMARLRALETPWAMLAGAQALSCAAGPRGDCSHPHPHPHTPLLSPSGAPRAGLARRSGPPTQEEASTMARLRDQEGPWAVLATVCGATSAPTTDLSALLPLAWPRAPVGPAEAATMARLQGQEVPWRQLGEAQALQGEGHPPDLRPAVPAATWRPYTPRPLSADEAAQMAHFQRLETPWVPSSGAVNTGCGDG